MIKSYIRVSTQHQEVNRQEYLLEQQGIKVDKAYTEKISGATTERPQLQQMLAEIKKGDIVYAESISRLGRNLKDLIEIIDTIIAKGGRVIVLKEGVDTNNSTYKLLLGIFGAVAEMERDTLKERQGQKIEYLKAEKEKGNIVTKSGRWFGRQEKTVEELPKDFKKYYNKMKNKEITKIEMSKLLGCSRKTVYRWIKLYEEEK